MPIALTRALVLLCALLLYGLDAAHAAAATSLVVTTWYESANCSTRVVRNDYQVVSPVGSACTKNAVCSLVSNDTDAAGVTTASAFVTGCTSGDTASMRGYVTASMGDDVDSVTWITYSDAKCAKFSEAADTLMTQSLETAPCTVEPGGKSTKFTYVAGKSLTTANFPNTHCTGTPMKTSIAFEKLGKCIPAGMVGLTAIANIGGKTYGVASPTPAPTSSAHQDLASAQSWLVLLLRLGVAVWAAR